MIRSAILQGIDAKFVEIEVGISQSETGFRIVGLPKHAVKESYERLINAFKATGYEWPTGHITINLAPADIPKDKASIELGIALAILEKSKQIVNRFDQDVYAIGELGLSGQVKGCNGTLLMGQIIPQDSILIAPNENRLELALLNAKTKGKGIKIHKSPTIFIVDYLSDAIDILSKKRGKKPKATWNELKPAFSRGIDFSEIKGQKLAKRAIEIAAAGGHNILLVGPPGEGKSLLAKAMPTILPRLTPAEAFELTGIYSARGMLSNHQIVIYRPFRSIHHTASITAVVGGGSGYPLPGEVTLAHRGVLFLDELPEFSRRLLETLRQPLEDGVIHLVRKNGRADYPCQFILVAAMNPCPCGFKDEYKCNVCGSRIPYGQKYCPKCGSRDKISLCKCTPSQISSYQRKISGPILDRIDLKIRVSSLTPEERLSTGIGETSKQIRERIESAREIQNIRYKKTDIDVNGHIPAGSINKYCQLNNSALDAVKKISGLVKTTRGFDKILKVARTIADLDNEEMILEKHIAEATKLCGFEEIKQFFHNVCIHCGNPLKEGDKYCSKCGAKV